MLISGALRRISCITDAAASEFLFLEASPYRLTSGPKLFSQEAWICVPGLNISSAFCERIIGLVSKDSDKCAARVAASAPRSASLRPRIPRPIPPT